jgi:hypothetical protein
MVLLPLNVSPRTIQSGFFLSFVYFVLLHTFEFALGRFLLHSRVRDVFRIHLLFFQKLTFSVIQGVIEIWTCRLVVECEEVTTQRRR